jgi:hypothetical protein
MEKVSKSAWKTVIVSVVLRAGAREARTPATGATSPRLRSGPRTAGDGETGAAPTREDGTSTRRLIAAERMAVRKREMLTARERVTP